jgi:hypothetical protein
MEHAADRAGAGAKRQHGRQGAEAGGCTDASTHSEYEPRQAALSSVALKLTQTLFVILNSRVECFGTTSKCVSDSVLSGVELGIEWIEACIGAVDTLF